MDWIEVSSRTLDEAIELALDRLGVVLDELEYEIIDEPRTGLFGIGRTDARIRARVKPLSREKPTDRRRRRGRAGERRPDRPRAQPSAAADVAAPGPSAEPGTRPRPESGRRRRGGRGRGRSGTRSGANGETRAVTTIGDEGETNEVDTTLSIDEQADAAARFTEELLRAMGARGVVDAEVVEDDIELRVEGSDLGVLVGPKGVTLRALEELIRAVVQHAAGGHSARVHVDVAGYRQRRREALAAFATQVAEQVRETGVPRSLEPMTPPDRKVVHDTVAEIDGVATGSEGEEPRRRVVIRPA
jgi:spoIIIJ-associated protein